MEQSNELICDFKIVFTNNLYKKENVIPLCTDPRIELVGELVCTSVPLPLTFCCDIPLPPDTNKAPRALAGLVAEGAPSPLN